MHVHKNVHVYAEYTSLVQFEIFNLYTIVPTSLMTGHVKGRQQNDPKNLINKPICYIVQFDFGLRLSLRAGRGGSNLFSKNVSRCYPKAKYQVLISFQYYAMNFAKSWCVVGGGRVKLFSLAQAEQYDIKQTQTTY